MQLFIRNYWWAGVLALLGLQALLLFIFGQPLSAAEGVRLWYGQSGGPGNSQHLVDWYTFSHVVHGFLFYWLFTVIAPRLPVAVRILMALGIEVSWELLENTPWLIEQYRQQALAAGYFGDSIVNSLSDSVAMLAGFGMARYLPVWASVFFAAGLEGAAAYAIHDNLTLNALNFLHQFEFIKNWQTRL